MMTEQEKAELVGFLNFLVEASSGQHNTIYKIALAALTTPPVPTQQWIKCSDRLPVEGQSVVIANIGHGCIYEAAAVTYYPPHFALMEGLEASNYDGGAPIHLALEATHWIALPAAPEPGGDAS